MSPPIVSVVIPAYNQADYLGEAIQSILDQTYPHFEIIVVNDASPDHTDEVVKRYSDPRLKYIVHEENRMLSATRNTGIRASTGEIIALLDADDIFHPEKLQAHVDFLNKHPEVGVAYNARFDIYDSAETIFELWRPPLVVELSDLVLGFPFAPSDMVLRRDWIFRIGLFDESYTMFSEDLDVNCRLALAGCQFASVDRALNYRRFYPGRIIRNLPGRLGAHLRALETTFSDPRCPAEVLALRNKAFMNKYLAWACFAFAQNETTLGQAYTQEAVRLDPTILEGKPCELARLLFDFSMAYESVDHEVYLKRAFAQLPPEMASLSEQYYWAVARGYLLRGTRAVIWGRTQEGHEHFERAVAQRAQIDDNYSQYLTAQLLSYEVEFGLEAARNALQNLFSYLEKIGNRSLVRRLNGYYSINQAFRNYRVGEYARVPKQVMRAFANDPKYLANRGVLSILFRSIVAMRSQSNS